MCLLGKLLDKTHDAQQNLRYVENCHYDKLKQKIVLRHTFRHLKMSNLFS